MKPLKLKISVNKVMLILPRNFKQKMTQLQVRHIMIISRKPGNKIQLELRTLKMLKLTMKRLLLLPRRTQWKMM
uniref:Uncharacterized protein n=1 Tax=Arundo donax TaxID=35708 RepID=A0A0A9I0W0_ARUDO